MRPLRRFAAVAAMLLGALIGASLIDHALALPLAAAALCSLLALVPLIPRHASSCSNVQLAGSLSSRKR